ncbi:MAG: hypothetical protein U9Q97_08030 [Acidobacteriota bacterium]|nr:hypothetical protein [Acidobacteriota bacterium]
MEEKYHFGNWYDLYLKCLKKEKEFYKENFGEEKTMKMYWWPSYHNEDILMLIYQQAGKDKFLEAFDIITKFPNLLLELHSSSLFIYIHSWMVTGEVPVFYVH